MSKPNVSGPGGALIVGATLAPALKVFKQGLLKKQGGSMGGWKTWKERWFVFHDQGISYYESEKAYKEGRKELGFMQMDEKLQLMDSASSDSPIFATNASLTAPLDKNAIGGTTDDCYFVVRSSSRTMTIKAPSVAIKREWLAILPKVRREQSVLESLLKINLDESHGQNAPQTGKGRKDGSHLPPHAMSPMDHAGSASFLSSGLGHSPEDEKVNDSTMSSRRPSESTMDIPLKSDSFISSPEQYSTAPIAMSPTAASSFFNRSVNPDTNKESPPNGSRIVGSQTSASSQTNKRDSLMKQHSVSRFLDKVVGKYFNNRGRQSGVGLPGADESDDETEEASREVVTSRTRSRSVKEGYLNKLGNRIQNWKRRYFILLPAGVHGETAPPTLEYYKNPYDKKPVGTIKLNPEHTILQHINLPHTFAIQTAPNTRKFIITADDDRDRDAWLEAIQSLVCARVLDVKGNARRMVSVSVMNEEQQGKLLLSIIAFPEKISKDIPQQALQEPSIAQPKHLSVPSSTALPLSLTLPSTPSATFQLHLNSPATGALTPPLHPPPNLAGSNRPSEEVPPPMPPSDSPDGPQTLAVASADAARPRAESALPPPPSSFSAPLPPPPLHNASISSNAPPPPESPHSPTNLAASTKSTPPPSSPHLPTSLSATTVASSGSTSSTTSSSASSSSYSFPTPSFEKQTVGSDLGSGCVLVFPAELSDKQSDFVKFASSIYSEENIYAWLDIEKFRRLTPTLSPEKTLLVGAHLYEKYVTVGADFEVNVPPPLKQEIGSIFSRDARANAMAAAAANNGIFPSKISVAPFESVQRMVLTILREEVLPKFLHEYPEVLSEEGGGRPPLTEKERREREKERERLTLVASLDYLLNELVAIDINTGSVDHLFRRAFILNHIFFTNSDKVFTFLSNAFSGQYKPNANQTNNKESSQNAMSATLSAGAAEASLNGHLSASDEDDDDDPPPPPPPGEFDEKEEKEREKLQITLTLANKMNILSIFQSWYKNFPQDFAQITSHGEKSLKVRLVDVLKGALREIAAGSLGQASTTAVTPGGTLKMNDGMKLLQSELNATLALVEDPNDSGFNERCRADTAQVFNVRREDSSHALHGTPPFHSFHQYSTTTDFGNVGLESVSERESTIAPSRPLRADELDRADITDFRASHIARAMTMFDHTNFRLISARELANKEWTRTETQAKKAANVLAMVELFNRRSYWVASEILNREEGNARLKCTKVFIEVANHQLAMGNYYSVFAIINGLGLSPVFRLNKTLWAKLSSATKEKFDYLRDQFTDSARNFRVYRKIFKAGVGKPQIPHFAVILKDCYQLEEIKTVDANNNIHFHKYIKQWRELGDVLQGQRFDYHLNTDANILQVLKHLWQPNMLLPEDKLWQRSYRFEPKESAGGTPIPTNNKRDTGVFSLSNVFKKA